MSLQCSHSVGQLENIVTHATDKQKASMSKNSYLTFLVKLNNNSALYYC